MMNNERRKVWEKIMHSSAHMAEVAQKNDWELLQSLVDERKKLLSEFFSEPIAQDRYCELDRIVADIDLILKQDRQTKKRSLANKQLVINSLKKFNTGRAAQKLYS